MQMVDSDSGIPRVITIFSAPNYCDVYKNKAACLRFDNAVLNIKQFINSPHPYYLPNFMDVFHWSLPFVAEKVTDMLANVMEFSDEQAVPDESKAQVALQKKGGMFRKKVKAVSRLLRVYKILRQENEAIINLKQLTPHHKVPMGLLSKGPEEIRKVIHSFEAAKNYDKQWESRPTQESRAASPVQSPRAMQEWLQVGELKNQQFRQNAKSKKAKTATVTTPAPVSS
jgi:serine/threonine-protein phosphatase 2B catalytic subunit